MDQIKKHFYCEFKQIKSMPVLFQEVCSSVSPMLNVSLYLFCILAYMTNLKSFHNVTVHLRAIYSISDSPSETFPNDPQVAFQMQFSVSL